MDYNKMPTNSFDNFYLSWVPDKRTLSRPFYLSLANSLEADIISGKLAAGTRLPPQRELADYLDINFTTVTRAYDLCREKNLIYAVVGSGTFVSPLPGQTLSWKKNTPGMIELGLINSFNQLRAPVIEATEKILKKSYLEQLYSYAEPAGHLHQRAAGAHWMAQMDVHTDCEHTAIFSGAQNVISTTLLSLFKIGDKLAVDEYTYANLIGAAKLSHVSLLPVAGDPHGMLPQALEEICRKTKVSGVFLMPNCANPTTRTMTESRKDELAEIAARYDLIVIEDDNTGILSDLPGTYHSLFTRLPGQTIYICNATMALCNGLRVTFAAFPENFRSRLLEALFHLHIKSSSLDAEIITELILNGKAQKLLEQKRQLAVERNLLFNACFPEISPTGPREAFFRWLPLAPTKKSGPEIENDLRKKGVNVYHSCRFAVGRTQDHFLRFAISSPASQQELSRGLEIIREYLKERSLL